MSKRKSHYTITYDKVTAESAADGDVADHGFYAVGGWDHSLCGDDRDAVVKQAQAGEFDYPCSHGWLKDAWNTVGPFHRDEIHAQGSEVSARGYPDQDYRTGAWTTLTLHVKCPTEASAARVARALIKGR